jgi:maltooligosyltrehalose trehalohydrolase
MVSLPRSDISVQRRLPIGAEAQQACGVHFRVWAPAGKGVWVEIEGGPSLALSAEPGGYFSGLVAEAGVDARYRFRLEGQALALPDPASRFQPEGPHGASQVVDPARFAWSDAGWRGIPRERLVIYEMHIGTFTPAGTWDAAAAHLPALAELGITAVEVMPVAGFEGPLVWG